ncbi:MAG TPA: hypothetical protein VMX13_16460 [Sedimentisphaerales bacterium]|nr:hypothetical protein [Sedimentisphaerales bacterium]
MHKRKLAEGEKMVSRKKAVYRLRLAIAFVVLILAAANVLVADNLRHCAGSVFEEMETQQIFRDHFRFMTTGVIFGTGLLLIPRQGRGQRRFSIAILSLAVLYPVIIVLLYANRESLGESYAYLILGDLLAILIGITAGIIFLVWFVLSVIVVKRRGNIE